MPPLCPGNLDRSLKFGDGMIVQLLLLQRLAQYWFCANSKSSLIVKFRISQICRLAPSCRVWRAREGHLGMPGAARQMMVPELASQFSADTEDRLFKLDRFLPGSATRIRQPGSLAHTRSCAGFITATSGFRPLVRTTVGFSGSIRCMIRSRNMNVCAIAAAT